MKNAIIRLCAIVALLGFGSEMKAVRGITGIFFSNDSISPEENVEQLMEKRDSIRKSIENAVIYNLRDTLDLWKLSRAPYISVQQYLKGTVPGVYVQETTGEPGSIQNMLIRGVSSPVFSKGDMSAVQPVVFLNGIPLLTDDSFVYNVKSTEVNPIGTATNILSGLNLDNVASIEVVKDAARLAKLGPLAANGAILINMKDGFYGGKNMFIRANGGMAIPPSDVKMTNAANDYAFRMQFTNYCSTDEQRTSYLNKMPVWMKDIRDMNFYGRPEWADDYYSMAPLYNFSASMGSGGRLANYIFMIGYAGSDGVADKTSFDKLTASFALNMKLMDQLGMSCLINASRVSRNGNRNLLDRYAEIEYLPDLTTPLSPVASVYNSYLDLYEEYKKNDNLNNLLNGYLAMNYNWNGLLVDTRLLLDYNTNVRHVFWPMDLMESVNYVSNYSGYNRRLIWNSSADYKLNLNQNHFLGLNLQAIIMKSVQHYNYTQGYDGKDDTKPTTSGGGFAYMKRYVDKMTNNMVSTLFSVDYRYKDIFDAQVIFRGDGSSNVQKDNRWLFTPAISAGVNLKKLFLRDIDKVTDWALRGSWARIGRYQDNNRFAAGPQYTGEELTGIGQPIMSSYYGYASIARPYNTGWVGYGLGWPYSDKWNVGINSAFFNNRLSLNVEYYNNTDCDLITAVPVKQEYGYKYKYANGMRIRNSGFEVTLAGQPFNNSDGFSWDTSFSLAYNKNELVQLPENLDELLIGNRKLKVGHSIDEFWLYQNEGVYASDAEVPEVDGKKLSMNSIPFAKNDPKWKDQNGDNIINDDDRILKGHTLPPVTGNFVNNFQLGRFDLGINLFFALGHEAINYRSSQRYNFLTLENTPSLESLREIFFWQNTNDKNDYPLYNQMSGLTPYRAEQDLFLERLSYLKLRSLTLGYTLPLRQKTYKGGGKKKEVGKRKLNDIYFYVTGNNLFTLTGFSGDDPELVDVDGYYRGYGQPLSRSVILGVKFNF